MLNLLILVPRVTTRACSLKQISDVDFYLQEIVKIKAFNASLKRDPCRKSRFFFFAPKGYGTRDFHSLTGLNSAPF